MWLFGLGVLAILASLAGKAKGESMSHQVDIDSPRLITWQPLVQALAIQASIPWQYAMAWIGFESGGNPCAVGEPNAKGPDGQPKELGLFQLYNPDDLKRFKATGAELRTYCVPGTQRKSRNLTSAEMTRQVTLGIELIKYCAKQSGHYMSQSGVTWPTTGKDFWRGVKLWHALPVIVSKGFASVTAKLGRPPATWAEFRRTYENINPRARFVPGKAKQDGYYRALENAEKTGGFVPDKAVG